MAAGDVIWTWFKGDWHQGNVPIMGAADHGTWLGSLVFDGARAFEGMTPDLEAHMARVNASTEPMGLKPTMSTQELVALVQEGLGRFAPEAAVYIRPMYWSTEGGRGVVVPDPDSTAFALCLEQIPMAPADAGQRLGRTRFVRPMLSMAPVNAKAACLYPNNGRMIREAQARGFDNALVADALGNVAETATSNIFLVRDGVVQTPVPNGTFLDGITRQRIIRLLRADGVEVQETTLSFDDFSGADEVFMTGNMSKVTPVLAFEDRDYEIGPMTRRARELYWNWARETA